MVTVLLLIGRGLLHAHLLPLRAQLIGRHHRETGANPLAHLGTVVDERHPAIGIDLDEHVGIVHPATRHGARPKLRLLIGHAHVPASRQQQRRHTGDAFQHAPTADVGQQQCIARIAHELASSPAARSTAAKMRL